MLVVLQLLFFFPFSVFGQTLLSIVDDAVSASVSDDGKIVVVGCLGGIMEAYKVNNNTYSLYATQTQAQPIVYVQVSSDGSSLMIIREAKIQMFVDDLVTFAEVGSFCNGALYLSAHFNEVQNLGMGGTSFNQALIFSPDTNNIYQILNEPTAPVTAVHSSQDGSRVVLGTDDHIYVYSKPTNYALAQTIPNPILTHFQGVKLTDDGGLLFALYQSNQIDVYQYNSTHYVKVGQVFSPTGADIVKWDINLDGSSWMLVEDGKDFISIATFDLSTLSLAMTSNISFINVILSILA